MKQKIFNSIAIFFILAAIVAFFVLIRSGTLSFSQKPIFIHEKVLLNPPKAVHNVRPVSVDDHAWGDINAPIQIIEYSDLECPYCKTHHVNMIRLVNEYRGHVVWIYRHHPLDHRFTKSRKEAEASECVAALGGNAAFWKFIGKIFEITPSNNGLDFSVLPDVAEEAGIDRNEFIECFENRTYKDKVEADFKNARLSGLTFTPSSIIIWPDRKKKSLIIGARSYELITTTLDIILGKKAALDQLPRDRTDGFSR